MNKKGYTTRLVKSNASDSVAKAYFGRYQDLWRNPERCTGFELISIIKNIPIGGQTSIQLSRDFTTRMCEVMDIVDLSHLVGCLLRIKSRPNFTPSKGFTASLDNLIHHGQRWFETHQSFYIENKMPRRSDFMEKKAFESRFLLYLDIGRGLLALRGYD